MKYLQAQQDTTSAPPELCTRRPLFHKSGAAGNRAGGHNKRERYDTETYSKDSEENKKTQFQQPGIVLWERESIARVNTSVEE